MRGSPGKTNMVRSLTQRGSSYFVGFTADAYQICDEDGNRTGTASVEEYGRPIRANEDDFICLTPNPKDRFG